jgi:hypothetical protein
LAVSDSPLRLVIGGAGGAHRGAIVGNLALFAGSFVVLAAVGAVVRLVRDEAWTVVDVLRTVRLPGSWLAVLVLPLLPSTVLSSVVVLMGPRTDRSGTSAAAEWRSWDLGAGVTGLCACAGLLGLVGVRLLAPCGEFGAVFRPLPAGWRATRMHAPRWTTLLVLHRGRQHYGTWRPVEESGEFVARYGLLFDGCIHGRHWWPLAEVLQSVALAVLASSAPPSSASVAAWVAGAVQVVWLGLLVVVRPYMLRLDTGVSLAMGLLCVVASVDVAVGGADSGGDATTQEAVSITSACIGLVSAVVPAVAEVAALRALLARMRAGMEAGIELPQMSNVFQQCLPTSWFSRNATLQGGDEGGARPFLPRPLSHVLAHRRRATPSVALPSSPATAATCRTVRVDSSRVVERLSVPPVSAAAAGGGINFDLLPPLHIRNGRRTLDDLMELIEEICRVQRLAAAPPPVAT